MQLPDDVDFDLELPPPMPDASKPRWLLKLVLAAFATLGGWVAVTAFVHVWNLKADTSVVAGMASDIHTISESQKRLEVKIDSANLRITQIRCGRDIDNGCR